MPLAVIGLKKMPSAAAALPLASLLLFQISKLIRPVVLSADTESCGDPVEVLHVHG